MPAKKTVKASGKRGGNRDAAAALEAYQELTPNGYEELCEFAALLDEERRRLVAEDPKRAPRSAREMFEVPPAYECPDTALVVGAMLGYLRAASEVAGVEPWEIIEAVVSPR